MTVLLHPTVFDRAGGGSAAARINAELLWRHCGQPTRVELHPLTVDGVEYLTDGTIMVRTARLSGVPGTWAVMGAEITRLRDIHRFAAALRARPSARLVTARFHPYIVCGLFLAGAGIAPLTGQHRHDMHAVVVGNDPIGLVAPLRPDDAELMLGAVPGVPPWPPESDPNEPHGTGQTRRTRSTRSTRSPRPGSVQPTGKRGDA